MFHRKKIDDYDRELKMMKIYRILLIEDLERRSLNDDWM